MLPRFNILIEWLCRWYLAGVVLSQRYIDTVRELLGKGTLFYVIRDRSYYETIAFNYLLRKNDLPIVPFAGNLRLWRLAPVGQLLAGLRDWFLRLVRLAPGGPGYRERLVRTVRDQKHGLVFLKRGQSILREFWQGNDPFAILIEEARHTKRPIYLLPQFAIVDQRPEQLKPPLAKKFLLGSSAEPSMLRRAWQVAKAMRSAKLECGQPLHLQEFLAANPGVPDRLLTRKLKLALLQEFAAERKVYAGPPLRPRLDLKSEILRSPGLYDFMIALAEREGVSKEEILKRADKILDEMASDPNMDVAVILKHILFWGLGKGYKSVEVDNEGLEGVKAALKQGAVILVPNHSSHVDYLILSCLFHNEHLVLPHIAAGDNLTFWPMGPIFRKSSAFFIRRSFRGDRLYTQVFDTYLNYLMSEGFPIEFFIEGTRSRNGKLRPPQFGMLSRIVGGYADGVTPKLTFIPVGIDYERIFEEGAYRTELEGGSKNKESMAALFRLPRMLNSDRGHIYLRFGPGIDMAEYAKQCGLSVTKPNERREVTRRLGYEIARGIQRSRTVTASSLVAGAVLSKPHGPASFDEIVERSEFFRELLLAERANLGVGLGSNASAEERRGSIRRAVDRLVQADLLVRTEHEGKEILAVAPGEYLVLDYYRNALINPLISEALTSLLLLGYKGQEATDGIEASAIEGSFEWLSSILTSEIVSLPALGTGIEALSAAGCIRNGTDPLQITDAGKIALTGSVIRALLEAYFAIFFGLGKLEDESIDRRDLFEFLHSEAQALYVSSRISCRELLSTAVVDRAIEMLVERGVVEREERSNGPKGGTINIRKPDNLREMADKLAALL